MDNTEIDQYAESYLKALRWCGVKCEDIVLISNALRLKALSFLNTEGAASEQADWTPPKPE